MERLLGSGYGDKDTIALFDIENILNEGIEDKDISNLKVWSSDIVSPSFVCNYKDYLFTVSEVEDSCRVYMYRKNGLGYDLIDQKDINIGGVCHISYLPLKKILLLSSYQEGIMFTLKVNTFQDAASEQEEVTEQLDAASEQEEIAEQIEVTGLGHIIDKIHYDKNENKESRIHCGISNHDNSEVFIVNIATDKVFKYTFDEDKLIFSQVLKLEEGTGPRHIMFNKSQDMLFVMTEYSNELIVIGYKDRVMKLKGKVSTLPSDYEGESFGSSICLSQNGSHIYVANRGANSIAHFELSAGSLKRKKIFEGIGNWPRHIDLVYEDQYLAIANRKSNEIVLVSRDINTGELLECVKRIEFENVTYVEGVK